MTQHQFKPADLLSDTELSEVRHIVENNQPCPHKAISAWMEGKKRLKAKLAAQGLNTEYFAWTLEYICSFEGGAK